MYREGVALAKSQPQEAARHFEQILALPNHDSEPGVVEKNRRAKEAKTATSTTTSARTYARRQLGRIDYAYEARQAIGLMSDEYYGGGRRMMVWTPREYSQARMAAIGWLYRFARDDKQADKYIENYKQAAEEAAPRPARYGTTPISRP